MNHPADDVHNDVDNDVIYTADLIPVRRPFIGRLRSVREALVDDPAFLVERP
jgi:hypothetical protein